MAYKGCATIAMRETRSEAFRRARVAVLGAIEREDMRYDESMQLLAALTHEIVTAYAQQVGQETGECLDVVALHFEDSEFASIGE